MKLIKQKVACLSPCALLKLATHSKLYLSDYCSHNAGSRDAFSKGNSKGIEKTLPFLYKCLLTTPEYGIYAKVMKSHGELKQYSSKCFTHN